MRFQTLALMALVATVVLAREDTAEVCSGALSCDEGYCCSSHGFCGRSPLHCSHSSGCNAAKGACGVVVYDKEDQPRVIPYDKLDHKSTQDLAKKLTDEGSHISPDEKKSGKSLESVLHDGLAEKEKMTGTKPAGSSPAAASGTPTLAPVVAPPNPFPDSANNTAKGISPPGTPPPASAVKTPAEKSDASRIVAGTVVSALFSTLYWLL